MLGVLLDAKFDENSLHSCSKTETEQTILKLEEQLKVMNEGKKVRFSDIMEAGEESKMDSIAKFINV